MRKRLAPLHESWLRFWRNSSAAKVPNERREISTPSWAPQPRAPEWEKGAHIISGYNNQQGSDCLRETDIC